VPVGGRGDQGQSVSQPAKTGTCQSQVVGAALEARRDLGRLWGLGVAPEAAGDDPIATGGWVSIGAVQHAN
jgi:hypothetical protein